MGKKTDDNLGLWVTLRQYVSIPSDESGSVFERFCGIMILSTLYW